MSLKKNIKKIILVSGLFFGLVMISQPQAAQASDTNTSWSQSAMTLGTSLTAEQKQGTLDTLSAALTNKDYQTIPINGDTLVQYLNPSGESFTSASGVWSSAAVEKMSEGSGINVKILNYQGKNNITTITADQYKNAALTAGVSDVNIYVTSAVPIDGSGALAGVYAAFAANGVTLNAKQVSAAQEEMNTLSDITQQNSDKDGYSDAQLNNAVAGAKEEMAKTGSSVTDAQIAQIVDEKLKENNLGTVINNNQKTQIINILIKVRDSGALDSAAFKKQASKLISNIQSNAKNIFNKLNTTENRNFLQKILDGIGNFFSGIVTWFQDSL